MRLSVTRGQHGAGGPPGCANPCWSSDRARGCRCPWEPGSGSRGIWRRVPAVTSPRSSRPRSRRTSGPGPTRGGAPPGASGRLCAPRCPACRPIAARWSRRSWTATTLGLDPALAGRLPHDRADPPPGGLRAPTSPSWSGSPWSSARWLRVRGRWLYARRRGWDRRVRAAGPRRAERAPGGRDGHGRARRAWAATARDRGTRALGAATLGLLLVDPGLASAAGFALSVLATAGILLLAPRWRDALARWLPRWLAEAVAVPAAAQLACTPLVAAISGQVSLVAVLANLLAAPAVGPATVLGLHGRAPEPGCRRPLGRVVGLDRRLVRRLDRRRSRGTVRRPARPRRWRGGAARSPGSSSRP